MTDTVKEMVSAALRGVEAQVDKHGWDKPPVLCAFGQLAERLEVHQLRYAVGAMPGIDLRGLANELVVDKDRARRLLAPLHGMRFFGLALCFEAWGASAQLGTAEASELAVDGYNRRIRDRGDRVELRGVAAVTLDGGRYYYERIRGGEAQMVEPDTWGESGFFEALERLGKVLVA